MLSDRKKQYMKIYNQKPEVKAKKREYMRRMRAEKDREAARRLVLFLSEMGYTDWAEEIALERAPEMLATVRAPRIISRENNK